MLEIRLLGQFALRIDEELLHVPSRPAQSLFAYLVLNRHRTFRRERLSGMFWPDASESNARSNLRHALWRARRAIDDAGFRSGDYFLVDNLSIGFNPNSACWVDVHTVADNDAALEDDIDSMLARAAVYGGDLLPGFYDDWVVLERERLRAVFEQLMQKLIDSMMDDRRWRQVLEWGERWVALGQIPEPAYRAVMVAYDQLGDRAGVVNTYNRCVSALKDELSVEPSLLTNETFRWLIKGGPKPVEMPGFGPRVPAARTVPAVNALFDLWQQQGRDVLDVASLALIHAAGHDLELDAERTKLVITSALQHGLELDSWLERASSPESACESMAQFYQTNPASKIKMRLIQALKGMGPCSARHLEVIVRNEEIGSVREAASVALAELGHGHQVSRILADELRRRDSPSALQSFVAMVDYHQLPPDIGDYPRIEVMRRVLRRRWSRHAGSVGRIVIWACIGGFIAGIPSGAIEPFAMAVGDPVAFADNLEITSLGAWITIGAVAGIFTSVMQMASTSWLVGMTDALSHYVKRRPRRHIVGLLSGFITSLLMIWSSFSGLAQPEIGATAAVWLFIAYGFARGWAFHFFIPKVGLVPTISSQVIRLAWVLALLFIINLVLFKFAYPATFTVRFAARMAGDTMLATTIALIISHLNRRLARDEWRRTRSKIRSPLEQRDY